MNHSIKLAGFAVAVGLLGFAPFALLSRSQLGLPTERVFRAGTFFWAESAEAAHQQPSSTIHLQVSLSKRNVALYRGDTLLKTYPIAIGQDGWETPTGTFQVKQMLQNPDWIHPFTDELIATDDPRNPLGRYWIGFWSDGRNSIGFHGTPDVETVGLAASHGCLRMYSRDIEELFHVVQLDTPVTVVQ